MREARRVDLRNGVNIKQYIEEEEQKWRQNIGTVDQKKQSLGIEIIFIHYYYYSCTFINKYE